MARDKLLPDNGVDVGVFGQFSGVFSGSAWRPYYVRWERQARLRFEHPWLLRAEVEVHNSDRAFGRVVVTSPSGRRASPVGEEGYDELRAQLEHCGYELRHEPRLPQTLFLKRFRATGPRIAAVRREVEARLWREVPARRPGLPAQGGIPGALRQFLDAPAWAPSSCGWSRRLRLGDGVVVILALLLMQGAKRQNLHPEACVQLEAVESIDRQRLRELMSSIRAAGYRGKVDKARPAGREPFLFGHFWKAPLGSHGAAGERARLDELAKVMRRLR